MGIGVGTRYWRRLVAIAVRRKNDVGEAGTLYENLLYTRHGIVVAGVRGMPGPHQNGAVLAVAWLHDGLPGIGQVGVVVAVVNDRRIAQAVWREVGGAVHREVGTGDDGRQIVLDEKGTPARIARVYIEHRDHQGLIQLSARHGIVQVFPFRRVNCHCFWAETRRLLPIQHDCRGDDAEAFRWKGNVDEVVAGQGTL